MLLMLINILFWSVVIITLHSYFIYPLMIYIISLFFSEKKNPDIIPSHSISIIISAFNEEKVIKERILNLSRLNYDFNQLEVIIGSDGSTDHSNDILTEMKETFSWLSVYLFNSRRGKVSVINDLVDKARNEIIVFTDANTAFNENSLKLLVRQFGDNNIGGVCGRLILSEPKTEIKETIEEKRYWEYETFIKKNEGKCGILIGANGGIFAIRKQLFKPLPTPKPITDDIFMTLMILNQNYKFSFEYDACGYEDVGHELTHEFNRKTRFAATNFNTLSYFKNLIFNGKFLLIYALWSHKIIRWFTPVLLILIFILNLFLLEGIFFQIFLCLQLLFYFLSFLGYLFLNVKIKSKIFTIPFYFVMTNIAMFIGMINFLLKRQSAFWQPTPR
jgi:poly-beta-1,6-N-acetyl-D-glucosamine synthase